MKRSFHRREFLALSAGAAGAFAAGRAGAESAEKIGSPLTFSRNLPLTAPYDVVVCGGGPAGVAAALAARRTGATVLLVESMGQLGGMGVSGLVSHWLGGRSRDCRRWVVGGIFRMLVEEAVRRGFALLPKPPKPPEKYQPHGWKSHLVHGIPFDPFGMAHLFDQRVIKAGVEMLLLTEAVDAVVSDGRITHIITFNKSGLAAVPVKAVIDATGDADIAARCGCPYAQGEERTGGLAPATLQFHVDHVDQNALAEYIQTHDAPRFTDEIRKLREVGQWPFPYDIFISVQLQEPGTMMINTSRLVGIDGTDGKSMTCGMIQGREETQKLLGALRKHFPGFANARIKAVAPLLGVRETRRIRGDFVLTVKDLTSGKSFEDTIGLTSYGWDLPNPTAPSQNPGHGKLRSVTSIPYRVMLPKPVKNLICPGRAISAERPVLGPLRVMAPCMAMGEAAGQAAGLAVPRQAAFGEVDVALLRKELLAHGAILS